MHLLYKKQGETCLECLQRLKNDLQSEGKPVPVSLTYAGRLDPLAAGLLIALEGDEIKEKESYLGLKKTYEFEVVLGVATDTFDQLGIVASGDTAGDDFLTWPTLSFDQDGGSDDGKLGGRDDLLGKVRQTYPFYSSKPIDGIPLFQYVKDHGIDATIPKLPTNEVEIYEIEILSREQGKDAKKVSRISDLVEETMTLLDGSLHHAEISPDELAIESIVFAQQIKGDFRQNEIIESWKKWQTEYEAPGRDDCNVPLKIMKFSMTVSSGFYIRSFACWLGQRAGVGAIARNIMRVKAGDFTLK